MSRKAIRGALQSAMHLHQAGDLDGAQRVYQKILQVEPAHADAAHLLGVIACQRGEFDRGSQLISRAISLSPGVSAFHNSMGNALRGLGRLAEAIVNYQAAVSFNGNNLQSLNNLAVALDDADRSIESLACFDRLISAKNDVPEWHTNRGSAQVNAGHISEAILSLRQALHLRPGFATAHAKLSAALLVSGAFAEGWVEAEWRFQVGLMTDPGVADGKPRWDGSPLGNRTLLIFSEQGFGDSIQFVRYAAMIPREEGRVFVQCPLPLRRLLLASTGVDEVTVSGQPVPEHDVQIPVLSLPLVFRTDASSIPAKVPYISINVPAASHPRMRVGLVWAGNAAHANDRRRSCPAKEFDLLSGLAAIIFVSLQFPPQASPPQILNLQDQTAGLADFADTAALISTLDLVISVDTAVAHLSGAMAKPTWILLPYAGEWRWMTNREDSPWYPTARLFRQQKPGDWRGVLHRVRSELEAMVNPG